MQINGYNTEVTVTSPKDSYGYFASKHKTDEIEQVSSNSQRIWIGVIIKSPTEDIIIKKNKAFGIFVWESKGKIGIKPETEIKKRQPCQKYRKKLQTGGFLNRYDFAYAGRDTVDQLGKVAPGIIKSASSVINNISQHRINQIIRQEGQEMKRVLPKILQEAIEDVYQTPFSSQFLCIFNCIASEISFLSFFCFFVNFRTHF